MPEPRHGLEFYRDAGLSHYVATVPGTDLQFIESNLVAGQSYSYYVVADYANGFSATIGMSE